MEKIGNKNGLRFFKQFKWILEDNGKMFLKFWGKSIFSFEFYMYLIVDEERG